MTTLTAASSSPLNFSLGSSLDWTHERAGGRTDPRMIRPPAAK
ncbi:hypothetical protein [Streptomyces sp. NPDC005385]